MKKLFLTTLTLVFFSILTAQTQKIEVKDGNILLDDSQILKYENKGVFEFSIYSMDDNELIYVSYNNNETREYQDDDFIVIKFLSAGIKAETTKKQLMLAGLGLNPKSNIKKFVTTMLKEKILSPDGTLDNEKTRNFCEKYDENITNRTLR